METVKRYFKFYDGSIVLLPVNWKFTYEPEFYYTSASLGFGEWKPMSEFPWRTKILKIKT